MRVFLRVMLVGALIGLLYLNCKLYYQPRITEVVGRPLNQELVQQLYFLKERLHQGAAADMQEVYPEGFVYANVLYGLTWIELASGVAPTTPLHQEALSESAWAIKAINSPQGRMPFDEDLPLPYGAYYQGWFTYLLGRHLAAQTPKQRAPLDVLLFEQHCAQIAKALAKSPTPYLESYAGAAWPADGVMCVAALAWHDRMFAPRYQRATHDWLANVRTHLDTLGMIPHQTDALTGKTIEAARGSSQSQLLNFLFEIDSTYARHHFKIYRSHFLTSRFGLPGLRESAQDHVAAEDIDSGPVLRRGMPKASIVGRRTMQLYGDTVTALGLRNSVEAFGIPLRSGGQKQYIFGVLPIADAFIAWSNSLEVNRALSLSSSNNWRFRFQVLSAVLAIGALIILLLLSRKPSSSDM
ncbi:hypothetical protein [Hymenobacter sp. GOD-10R]|uniref:hypothetical protein n=1 Tax=Hymenobacter sp. GOD-10R TaxID=3093922 RepID=UPI002D780656|nr:hypothetical protein [Hymenobacter sp. GOD-10R]WRQ29692.1 hypothetical protein SD425_05375 [Hymenobacter sp. GOD-10R]